MTILSIVASGIIAAAAAVFAFSAAAPRNAASPEPPAPSPHRRADQRGITLQTLIIMAVLVLIAAGASVVLLGITRGANDRLGDAGKISSEAKCEPWEIHNSEYEEARVGGPTGLGGVWSSEIGCVRVCYARFNLGQLDPGSLGINDRILSYADEASMPSGNGITVASLEFSRRERITDPQVPSGGDPLNPAPILNNAISAISGSQEYDTYANNRFRASRIVGALPISHSFTQVITQPSEVGNPIPIDDLEIRVANDLRSCILWDPASSKEIFRSQGTISP